MKTIQPPITSWSCLLLALATCLASCSALAQGTIVYVHLSTPNPDPNFPWDFQGMRLLAAYPQSYNLDFNSDGTPEYVISASGPFSSPFGFYITPQRTNSVWVQPTFDSSLAGALPVGVEIGPNLSVPSYRWGPSPEADAVFSSAMDAGAFGYYTYLDWAYCGLRFDLNGQTYYGWVRVGAPLALNGGWIYDYAYDTRPGAAILTGVPEPGASELAGVGVLLLNILRKGRIPSRR